MMVLEYYNLQEQPFGVTPDNRYLFLNPTYKEALASLVYGIESGCGFVALIAAPGSGKTTLLFQTLDLLQHKVQIVLLSQTIVTPLDLLQALLSALGVGQLPGNLVEMQAKLKDLLTEHHRMGKRVVLVIDEAQNLDDSMLEVVRMLSNFETPRDKLIQIILSGQPGLADNIGSHELLQLKQRVSTLARLKPFTSEETALYIAHRLRIAGYSSDTPVFTKDALELIAQYSAGIPRNINNLCFNALSLGCALQRKPIDCEVIREVVADLDLGPSQKEGSLAPQPEGKGTANSPIIFSAANTPSMSASWLPKAAVVIVVLLASGGGLFLGHRWLDRPVGPQPGRTGIAQPDRGISVQAVPTASVQNNGPAAPLDPAPAIQANGRIAPAEPGPPSSISAGLTPQSVHSRSYRVTPGRTLLGICVQEFGSCTPGLLRQIYMLNPSLTNPDHITPGQNIRLPVLAARSSAVE